MPRQLPQLCTQTEIYSSENKKNIIIIMCIEIYDLIFYLSHT